MNLYFNYQTHGKANRQTEWPKSGLFNCTNVLKHKEIWIYENIYEKIQHLTEISSRQKLK